ncbi:MAG: hypothetical protein ABIF77_06685 [bacterium]
MDASIRANLCDINGDPVVDFDRTKVWLSSENSTFAMCADGTIADNNSDVNGDTWFTGTLQAGGSSLEAPGLQSQVIVCHEEIARLDVYFNSPDIDGNLQVDLSDVVLFAIDYFGDYDYRSDFFWDGVLDLSDVVLMARGMNTSCP